MLKSGAYKTHDRRESQPTMHIIIITIIISWWRSIVVRTLVSAGELSLSWARLLAGCVTTLWLSRPLSVSQH